MWILLIFMWSNTGDFIGKVPIMQLTESQCQVAAVSLPATVAESNMRLESMCITHDHWTGKKYMPGVPLHR